MSDKNTDLNIVITSFIEERFWQTTYHSKIQLQSTEACVFSR